MWARSAKGVALEMREGGEGSWLTRAIDPVTTVAWRMDTGGGDGDGGGGGEGVVEADEASVKDTARAVEHVNVASLCMIVCMGFS